MSGLEGTMEGVLESLHRDTCSSASWNDRSAESVLLETASRYTEKEILVLRTRRHQDIKLRRFAVEPSAQHFQAAIVWDST